MSPEELKRITIQTLAHYEDNAESFWQGTKDHDVSQNIAVLLQYIEVPTPLELLDFGCGPGRDLKTFKSLGHHPVGLEGAAASAEMAREFSGCEVWEQNFLALNLPPARFDGVFANAVLFHVPSAALPRVLAQLFETIKPGGVLFCSNPRGVGQEGWQGERYGAYHDLETWRRYVTQAGFAELTHYYRPAGLPIEQQPWLATVWRKSME
jgi:SAM-dependent methyltransferase